MANHPNRIPSSAKAIMEKLADIGFARVEWIGTRSGAQSTTHCWGVQFDGYDTYPFSPDKTHPEYYVAQVFRRGKWIEGMIEDSRRGGISVRLALAAPRPLVLALGDVEIDGEAARLRVHATGGLGRETDASFSVRIYRLPYAPGEIFTKEEASFNDLIHHVYHKEILHLDGHPITYDALRDGMRRTCRIALGLPVQPR